MVKDVSPEQRKLRALETFPEKLRRLHNKIAEFAEAFGSAGAAVPEIQSTLDQLTSLRNLSNQEEALTKLSTFFVIENTPKAYKARGVSAKNSMKEHFSEAYQEFFADMREEVYHQSDGLNAKHIEQELGIDRAQWEQEFEESLARQQIEREAQQAITKPSKAMTPLRTMHSQKGEASWKGKEFGGPKPPHRVDGKITSHDQTHKHKRNPRGH